MFPGGGAVAQQVGLEDSRALSIGHCPINVTAETELISAGGQSVGVTGEFWGGFGERRRRHPGETETGIFDGTWGVHAQGSELDCLSIGIR